MKRTLVHLAVLWVCGRRNPQPVVLFGVVDLRRWAAVDARQG